MLVHPKYVPRKDLPNWISKEELSKGRIYNAKRRTSLNVTNSPMLGGSSSAYNLPSVAENTNSPMLGGSWSAYNLPSVAENTNSPILGGRRSTYNLPSVAKPVAMSSPMTSVFANELETAASTSDSAHLPNGESETNSMVVLSSSPQPSSPLPPKETEESANELNGYHGDKDNAHSPSPIRNGIGLAHCQSQSTPNLAASATVDALPSTVQLPLEHVDQMDSGASLTDLSTVTTTDDDLITALDEDEPTEVDISAATQDDDNFLNHSEFPSIGPPLAITSQYVLSYADVAANCPAHRSPCPSPPSVAASEPAFEPASTTRLTYAAIASKAYSEHY
jgi:hypothetical protein